MTLYGELGVKEGASYDEIRATYLRLAKTHHPDHVQDCDRDSADQRMSRLNYIISVLGDPKERAAYNAELDRQRAEADIRVREALALQALEASRRGRGTPKSRIRAALFGTAALAVVGVAAVIILFADFAEVTGRPRTPRPSDPNSTIPSRKTVSAPTGSETERQNPTVSLPDHAAPERLSEARRLLQSREPASAPGLRNATHGLPQPSAADARREAILAEARKALESPPAAPREIRGNEVARSASAEPPPPARPEPARTAAKEPAPPATTAAAAVPPAPVRTSAPPKSDPIQRWKGLWRYKADPRKQPVAQFSALDVEMRLQDVDSRVYGTYKAIYSEKEAYLGDVDLLLSAMSVGDDWVRGVWSGNRGAYGQFELKNTAGGIEMNWWTTKPGRTSARSSGSVLLTENRR